MKYSKALTLSRGAVLYPVRGAEGSSFIVVANKWNYEQEVNKVEMSMERDKKLQHVRVETQKIVL